MIGGLDYAQKVGAAMVMKNKVGKAADLVPCVGENKTMVLKNQVAAPTF